jgi:hypothetical protein
MGKNIGNKKMPWYLQHGRHHPVIECLFSEFVTHEVSMDPDDFDHMST